MRTGLKYDPTTIQVVFATPAALEPSGLADLADATPLSRMEKVVGQYARIFDGTEDASVAVFHILYDLLLYCHAHGVSIDRELAEVRADIRVEDRP